MTGLQRRTRRDQRRTRSSRAWVFGTAGLAAAAAAVGVAAILLTSGSTPASSRPSPLATNITSTQSIGLANPGPAKASGSATGVTALLSGSTAGLTFTPSIDGGAIQPYQQWTADQMGGGAYIMVFTADGLCLTAPAANGNAALARCQLGLSQRWSHPYLGTDSAGRTYWQLRSVANGRCLAVGAGRPDSDTGVVMQTCSSSKPWQQLVSFSTAF